MAGVLRKRIFRPRGLKMLIEAEATILGLRFGADAQRMMLCEPQLESTNSLARGLSLIRQCGGLTVLYGYGHKK